ncbi:hypothetical protein [Salinarimonas ramus]|uniref:Anti-sigma factor n=1 Tax=Salinarimonas ramus TaxID=690164 RepID=A0A917QKW0_9HYPH|nr:hypothetical protein [Salinarimonas ramus]GGK55585.1 hypothetical protein GCM10011322_47760 [Salinarimonas ramus]
MSRVEFADEELMALADGALDPVRTRRVEAAAAGDPVLAARIEAFRVARRATREARIDAEGGDALQARIASIARAAQPQADRRAPQSLPARPAQPRRSWRDLSMAASVALAFAVGGAIGYVGSPGEDPGEGAGAPTVIAVAAPLDGTVAEALAQIPSGARARLPDGREMHAVSTFRDGGSALCREVEIVDVNARTAVLAVACSERAAWVVRFSMAVPAGGDGYVPAGALEALDAYLAGIDAGPPLEDDEEQAALAGR